MKLTRCEEGDSPEPAEDDHGCSEGHQGCAVANRVQRLDRGEVRVLVLGDRVLVVHVRDRRQCKKFR